MSRSKSQNRKYSSARELADTKSSGFGGAHLKVPEGVKLFKPKAGVMLLDILPFPAGEGNPHADEGIMHWERTYFLHRGIGANSDSFVCPRLTFKERCPICEHRQKLLKESADDNEELIKDLAAKERQLFNVVNRREPDAGVQLWDISYHLFGRLLIARIRDSDEEDGWDEFFHLESGQGLTLKVGFVEESYAGRAYCKAETIDFKPRKEDYDDDVIADIRVLDDLLVVPDYDSLKKTFLQMADEGGGASAKRKKAPPVEDDDDEDEAPPARKKKAPPVDEDDGWDDLDDEEEQKPAKRKRR